MGGSGPKKKKASPRANNDPEKPANLFTRVEEFTGKKEEPKTYLKSAGIPSGVRNKAKKAPKELPIKKRKVPKNSKPAGKASGKKKADASTSANTAATIPRKTSPKAKKKVESEASKATNVSKKSGPKQKKATKKDGVAKGQVTKKRKSDPTGKKKKKKTKKEKEAEEEAEKQLYMDGFNSVDADKDGLISFTEFAEAMHSVGNSTFSHRNLVLLFNKAAKSSKIGLPDFMALRGVKPKPDKERKRRDRAARRSL